MVLAAVLLLAAMEVSTPVPAASAAPGEYFGTLPPGSALPNDASCAARVRRARWEPRPENTAANRTIPQGLALAAWTGVDARANATLLPRITGNFTGTTDEIIQWGACKWGVDEDLVRALAVRESNWRQSQLGDIHGGVPQSYGLLQVRRTVWGGTHPHSERSTAFNVDYALGVFRVCYEGHTTWLHEFTGGYRAGDEWGCVGLWYAGRWRTAAAEDYIAKIRRHLAERVWTTWPDGSGAVPPPAAPAPALPAPAPPTSAPAGTIAIYDDAPGAGFWDGAFGYATRNACDTTTATAGGCSYAIALTSWGALNFGREGGFAPGAQGQLSLTLNTHGQPLSNLSVQLTDYSGRNVIRRVRLSPGHVTASLPGGWVRLAVPLSELNPGSSQVLSVQLQNATADRLATIHVDEIAISTTR
jgi:autotransporter family porin